VSGEHFAAVLLHGPGITQQDTASVLTLPIKSLMPSWGPHSEDFIPSYLPAAMEFGD
jgi:hypothetical protein